MEKKDTKGYWFTVVGWALTVLLATVSSWGAMDKRLYEVEGRIRLVEAQTKNMDKNEEAIQQIQQSLIRIEGKLDLKEDKQWKRIDSSKD